MSITPNGKCKQYASEIENLKEIFSSNYMQSKYNEIPFIDEIESYSCNKTKKSSPKPKELTPSKKCKDGTPCKTKESKPKCVTEKCKPTNSKKQTFEVHGEDDGMETEACGTINSSPKPFPSKKVPKPFRKSNNIYKIRKISDKLKDFELKEVDLSTTEEYWAELMGPKFAADLVKEY